MEGSPCPRADGGISGRGSSGGRGGDEASSGGGGVGGGRGGGSCNITIAIAIISAGNE